MNDIKQPFIDKKQERISGIFYSSEELNKEKVLSEPEYVSEGKSNYERIHFFSRLNFMYMRIYARISNFQLKQKKPVTFSDIPDLCPFDPLQNYSKKLLLNYEKHKEAKGDKATLLIPFIKTFKKEIILAIFLCFLDSFSKLWAAFFLDQLINSFKHQDEYSYIWAICLIVLMLTNHYSKQWSFTTGQNNGLLARLSLIHFVYAKILRLNSHSIHETNLSKIINIIANDVNCYDRSFTVPFALVAPITLIVSTAMLWYLLGHCALIGVAYILLSYPIQLGISKLNAKQKVQQNIHTDKRIKLTSGLIEGIRPIKMYAWEESIGESIKKTRKEEIGVIKKVSFVESLENMLETTTVFVAGFLIFLLMYFVGADLTIEKVFSILIIFQNLRLNVIRYTQLGINFLYEQRIVFDRIQPIIDKPEISSSSNYTISDKFNDNCLEFENFSASWKEKKVLNDISFLMKKKEYTAIIGRVGSGKSSVLLACLKEIPIFNGKLLINGSIAYVEQEPFIFPGSVRDNILFGKPYNEEKYNEGKFNCSFLIKYKFQYSHTKMLFEL